MSAFDRVIAYDAIKQELIEIVDMLRHKDVYENIGATLPRGLILVGESGLGKSLMAKALADECKLPTYTVRRDRASDDFVLHISDTFDKAKNNAPSIVFMDDLDKFASEHTHRNAEEFIAVQSGIDAVADADVFVLATANDIDILPPSLLRTGRFDRVIEVECPEGEDAEKIIAHFLSGKKVGDDVNMNDLCKMISYSSCAELEVITNEAAIMAAYNRQEKIGMSDLIHAVMRKQYNVAKTAYVMTGEDELRRTALHEAGHAVCCEVLCPGSVGLISIRSEGHDGKNGFVHCCQKLGRRPYYIIVSLASKAAVELYYADHVASGCGNDIEKAYSLIRNGLSESATGGFGTVNVCEKQFHASEVLNSRLEAVTQTMLETYTLQAKNILLQNHEFLERIADELLRKGILLHSDIQRIRESVTVTPVAV